MGRGARRPAATRYAPDVRKDYRGAHSVFTNLGMLGMNVGLDVRVIDQIGLANPLAGHLTAGGRPHRTRQGMFPDWEVAEGPF